MREAGERGRHHGGREWRGGGGGGHVWRSGWDLAGLGWRGPEQVPVAVMSDKRRPALVVSRDNERRPDLVVCFITSIPRSGPDMAPLAATAETGLKVPSVVRFDKLAALDRSVIVGRLGAAPADWLAANRAIFFGVFGFGPP